MSFNTDSSFNCFRDTYVFFGLSTGPVVWYQRFEYAIGHWLQKSAEHMFGSVLCSPGCFSLFRVKALMDDNVMRTYATLPTEARHFLQYDQGTHDLSLTRC